MTADLVHVVDDDAAMRNSLAFLIGVAGFETRLYGNGADLLTRLPNPATGCVLTDMRMPGIDGLALLRRLRSVDQTLPVVMMTGHGDVPLAVEAMKLGASDFIEKPFEDEALLHTLRSAMQRNGARALNAVHQEFLRRIGTLSERERQVFEHLIAGATSKEIGRILDISPRTVEIYRGKLMAKTQAGSLQELVRWSVLVGLV